MVTVMRTAAGLWRVSSGGSVVASCSYCVSEGLRVLSGRLYPWEQRAAKEQIERRLRETRQIA